MKKFIFPFVSIFFLLIFTHNSHAVFVCGSGTSTYLSDTQCQVSVGGAVSHAMTSAWDYNAPSSDWLTMNNPDLNDPDRDIYAMWAADGSNIFAVGKGGVILRSDGGTWANMPSPTTADLYAIWGTSATNVYAGGADRKIYKYNGASWTAQQSNYLTQNIIRGIWGSSSSNIYIVQDGGKIDKYTSTWATTTSPTTQDIYAIWGTASSNFYIGGKEGKIYKYTTAWDAGTLVSSSYIYTIWGTASNSFYVAGAEGKIYKYTTAWAVDYTTNPIKPIYSLEGSSASNIYAVGQSGALLFYNGTWASSDLGDPDLHGVSVIDADKAYLVGKTGILFKKNIPRDYILVGIGDARSMGWTRQTIYGSDLGAGRNGLTEVGSFSGKEFGDVVYGPQVNSFVNIASSGASFCRPSATWTGTNFLVVYEVRVDDHGCDDAIEGISPIGPYSDQFNTNGTRDTGSGSITRSKIMGVFVSATGTKGTAFEISPDLNGTENLVNVRPAVASTYTSGRPNGNASVVVWSRLVNTSPGKIHKPAGCNTSVNFGCIPEYQYPVLYGAVVSSSGSVHYHRELGDRNLYQFSPRIAFDPVNSSVTNTSSDPSYKKLFLVTWDGYDTKITVDPETGMPKEIGQGEGAIQGGRILVTNTTITALDENNDYKSSYCPSTCLAGFNIGFMRAGNASVTALNNGSLAWNGSYFLTVWTDSRLMMGGASRDSNDFDWDSENFDLEQSDSYKIYKYNNTAWTLSRFTSEYLGNTDDIFSIYGRNTTPISLYATGGDGTVIKYDGTTWNHIDITSENDQYGVWHSSDNDVYTVGEIGEVNHYNGQNWLRYNVGNRNLYSIWGTASNDIYTGGFDKKVYRYNGTSWTPLKNVDGNADYQTTNTIRAIWGVVESNIKTIFLAQEGGLVDIYKFNSTTSTYTWTTTDVSSTTAQNLYAIWGTTSSNVYAAGKEGIVYKYNGTAWSVSKTASNPVVEIYSLWGNSAGTVILAGGQKGTIYKYNGTSWSTSTSISLGDTSDVYALWGKTETEVYTIVKRYLGGNYFDIQVAQNWSGSGDIMAGRVKVTGTATQKSCRDSNDFSNCYEVLDPDGMMVNGGSDGDWWPVMAYNGTNFFAAWTVNPPPGRWESINSNGQRFNNYYLIRPTKLPEAIMGQPYNNGQGVELYIDECYNLPSGQSCPIDDPSVVWSVVVTDWDYDNDSKGTTNNVLPTGMTLTTNSQGHGIISGTPTGPKRDVYWLRIKAYKSSTNFDLREYVLFLRNVTESSPFGTGNCFVATAVYGTNFQYFIGILQDFRDHYLAPFSLGQRFINFYYRNGPHWAAFINQHTYLKPIVGLSLLPFVLFSAFLLKTALWLKITLGVCLVGYIKFLRRRK